MQRTREFKGYVAKLAHDPATGTFVMQREGHPFLQPPETEVEYKLSAAPNCTAKKKGSGESKA